MSLDINELFDGLDLSAETRENLESIFAEAVEERVSIIEKDVTLLAGMQLDKRVADGVKKEKILIEKNFVKMNEDNLTKSMNSWINENTKLANDSLKNRRLEQFVFGVKELFESCYIETPESDLKLIEEQQNTIRSLIKENTEMRSTVSKLISESSNHEKREIFQTAVNGMSDFQADKMEMLTENTETLSTQEYRTKVDSVKRFILEGVSISDKQVPLTNRVGKETNKPTNVLSESVLAALRGKRV